MLGITVLVLLLLVLLGTTKAEAVGKIPMYVDTPEGMVVVYVTPTNGDEVCFKTEESIKCLAKGDQLNENYFNVRVTEYKENRT